MTAEQLIKELQGLSPDTKIVVEGYEGGYNDISSLKEISITPDKFSEWWDGMYDDDSLGSPAICIYGYNKKE